jgi:hypothetical protein
MGGGRLEDIIVCPRSFGDKNTYHLANINLGLREDWRVRMTSEKEKCLYPVRWEEQKGAQNAGLGKKRTRVAGGHPLT